MQGEIIMMELFIYKTTMAGKEVNIISFLPATDVFKTGLTNKSIVGTLINATDQVTPENIQYNPAFITLFQLLVKETSVADTSLHLAAEKQQSGYIYIIDQRDKNYPDTQFADIIGWFEVVEGKITSDSYQPNDDYLIVSNDGVVKLPNIYEQNLLAAMRG